AGGNAYVTGFTFSADFPTTAGAFDTTYNNNGDAFVTKLNPTGSALVYSTYLGGSDSDQGLGIAVDAGGNAYVTGFTFSADFPTTAGAFDTTYNNNGDAFVTKLNPTGSALVYSTYLGGPDLDEGSAIVVDAGGNAYVTGYTQSANFPTTAGAFDTTYNDNVDAFVAKIGTVLTPNITCTTNITVSNNRGLCGAIVHYPNPTVTDECPLGFTVSCTPTSGSFFPVGTTTVTCTVIDPCGGVATCAFTVTVIDTNPFIICCCDCCCDCCCGCNCCCDCDDD
ncbi:SBBP repeat-containing protein, partial [Priestia megaterium]|uniref:SBBP repeat-containing protein n=1 Tax=Priestia megaterium TaxID=1404 RepID=UPI0034599685